MNKKIKYSLLGVSLVFSFVFVAFKTDDRLFEIAKNLDIYATVFKELNALYVDEVNPTKTVKSSIQAMLKELDPYTVFYPEDDIEDYFTMNTGTYNGIGATIENTEGKHTVVMLFEESPADKAGVKIGDDVLKINGVDVTTKNEAEFGRLLKGQTGTNVKIQIKRLTQAKPIEITIARGVVKTPNVPHYGMINNEVGYILLTDFSATAAKEIKTATLELKDKGMKKLVLDLRGNPGGLLNMAVDICNFYIPKGQLVVETKGKVKEWNKKYLSMVAPLDTEMPIAVLINGSSASASEIVSGTLQDYDRAVLIGKRSFGKGLVQITRDLTFGTKMKITTSKYYIPSGRCIQAIDYGHRAADGSVAKLADSLKVAFKTKNGRIVYDGGGVEPDIISTKADLSNYTKALVTKKRIFDFATKYYFSHQNDKPAEKFTINNADFEDFEKWLALQNYNFKTEDQLAIDNLIKTSKSSGEYTKMKNQLDDLKKIADLSTSNLVKKYKSEISEQIELEILSRYYYQKAMKFVSFEKDEDIKAALKLFGDMPRYNKILSGK
jgi:carboxyl-terminal processing protease